MIGRALVALVATALGTQAQAPADSVACEGISVVSAELTHKEAMSYCEYAVRERKKVEKYWGPTWQEPIVVKVGSGYAIAQALVINGGKPGVVEMPLARARDRTGALLHELTHNYAFSANRFLYEGLGVYLQDKVGAARSFPNFGRPLDNAAAEAARGVASLDVLNTVRFPRPLSTVMENQAAYLLAGSFVKFLIDKKGLEKFRAVYASGDYEAVYNVPFSALEREWRSHLPRR